eukprot:10063347-Karenia_brevis.AAC.1
MTPRAPLVRTKEWSHMHDSQMLNGASGICQGCNGEPSAADVFIQSWGPHAATILQQPQPIRHGHGVVDGSENGGKGDGSGNVGGQGATGEGEKGTGDADEESAGDGAEKGTGDGG